MWILPIFERELRTEARHRFTYTLRVIGGLAAVLTAAVTTLWTSRFQGPAQLGAFLFGNSHAAVFVTIWLLVPLLTADCLSRERREGTLGLLFLTPLTATQIVLGKITVHFLRALTLWLAVIPVLTLPLLLGGIGWDSVLRVLLIDLTSIHLALAVGLLASARSRSWNGALLATAGFGLFLLGLYLLLYSGVFLLQVLQPGNPGFSPWRTPFVSFFGGGFVLLTGVGDTWQTGMLLGLSQRRLLLDLEFFVLSVLALMLAIRLAARRVERLWHEVPPTPRQQWWQRLLFEPRFLRRFFHARMRGLLDRNPIGWLQQYRTTARVAKWSWCLFVSVVESVLMTETNWWDIPWIHGWISALLLVGLSFSSAGSFRQERESGAMELILVTPLREGQVIWGRLRGLWGQFLPAVLLIAAFAGFWRLQGLRTTWWWGSSEPDLLRGFFLSLGCAYLTIPVVGLYFSLLRKSFLAAWLNTVLVAAALPCVLGLAAFVSMHWLQLGLVSSHVVAQSFFAVAVLQIGLGASFWRRLHRRLRRRQFALATGSVTA